MRSPRVRYSELLPGEFLRRLEERPVAYLPLGTLEWHGAHLPLGTDAFISEGVMAECARRLGGIVLPPVFMGPDRASPLNDGSFLYGMDFDDHTVPPRQLEGSCYWVSDAFFHQWIDVLLVQIKRAGFKAVFADGHGPSRWLWVERLVEREERFGLLLFGAQSLADIKWPSQIDHAARNETSMMLALYPDLVDLSQLLPDPEQWPQGVDGEDPRNATTGYGTACIRMAVEMVDEMFRAKGV